MSKRRAYIPSETHLALHPPSTLIDCPCGTRFNARPDSTDSEDDPNLCLTCNRSKWSRLWNRNRPIEQEAPRETRLETVAREITNEIDQQIVSITDRRTRR